MNLCYGLLRRMGLQVTGRRSKIGAMHGPMNHESLNGAHPALLVAQRCNSDVQLPYRFPITYFSNPIVVCVALKTASLSITTRKSSDVLSSVKMRKQDMHATTALSVSHLRFMKLSNGARTTKS